MQRRGFMLVEFIACLALLALAAGAAALSLRGRGEQAILTQALDQVAHADWSARQSAKRWGVSTEIMFDLDRGVITIAGDGAGHSTRTIELPPQTRIEQAMLGDGPASGAPLRVNCSVRGQTPSYALELSVGGHQRQWLVIAGLTGERERVDDAKDVQNILQLCQASSNDAR